MSSKPEYVGKHRRVSKDQPTVEQLRRQILDRGMHLFEHNEHSWKAVCLCGWAAGYSKQDQPILDDEAKKYIFEHLHIPPLYSVVSHRPDKVQKRLDQNVKYDFQVT